MSGIQANTLVDFSVFSIYDPNDAAKGFLQCLRLAKILTV